ncbi:hypothetical protein ABPG74_007240 [Tetrahymena malaccensis]
MIDSVFDYDQSKASQNNQQLLQNSQMLQQKKIVDDNSIKIESNYENENSKEEDKQNFKLTNNFQNSNQTLKSVSNKSFQNQQSSQSFVNSKKPQSLNQTSKNLTVSLNQQSNMIQSQAFGSQSIKQNDQSSQIQQQQDYQQSNQLIEKQILNHRQSKFENSIFQKIQGLLNPVNKLMTFNLKEYIKYYCCCFSKRKYIINEGMEKIQTRLDIQNIFHQLQEIEKLKSIILDEDQIKLFEILPRPVLRNRESQAQKYSSNSYFDFKTKPTEEKVEEAYNSLMKIVNKQKKSQRDLQLIQLLDENIFLNLQNKGLLKNKLKPDEKVQDIYFAKDEIIETNSIFQELQIQNTDIQLQEQQNSQEQEVEVYPFRTVATEEDTIKSDKYFKFYKENIKNSLNLL